MDKEILKKMVEMDTVEGKLIKLGEEVTELRFALQDFKTPVKDILLEMAQVTFVIFQLKAIGKNYNNILHDMLKKYSLEGEYSRIHDINCIKIGDIIEKEYKKNCERLGI